MNPIVILQQTARRFVLARYFSSVDWAKPLAWIHMLFLPMGAIASAAGLLSGHSSCFETAPALPVISFGQYRLGGIDPDLAIYLSG
jgi:hypothetical protein